MSNLRKLFYFCFLVGVLAALGAAAGCSGRPKYPSCNGDKDCKEGEHCVNKKCVQCRDDQDCPAGQACVSGGCEAVEGYCASDADCGVFEVCKNNRCQACSTNEECGPGGQCRAGKCIRPGTCETHEDCPEDEDCVNNRCTKVGQPSTNIPSCPMPPIYFGFDEYTLGELSKNTLQKIYDCLQANKDRTIAVVGHTDPRGTVEYNISLSDDRAQAVITYLGRLGVDPARMRKVPKGAAEAKGVDEGSYAQDRRVEFVWE